MKEKKKIELTQKWIGDAVKKLLQKEDIYESDMERIKYLCIGGQGGPFGRISACLQDWRCCGFIRQTIRI